MASKSFAKYYELVHFSKDRSVYFIRLARYFFFFFLKRLRLGLWGDLREKKEKKLLVNSV